MKKMNLLIKTQTAAVAASFALIATHAQAQTLTWDHDANGVASDGSGTWLNPNQWINGGAATWNNGIPNDAIIGSGGTGGTIDLTGGVIVGDATFDNYTGKYRLSNGNLQVNGTLTWGPNTTASGTNDGVEFLNTASISGNGTIVVNGNYAVDKSTGQFNIRSSDVSAFTGTWNVQNGILFTEGNFRPSATSNIILNGNAGAGNGAVYSSRWGQTLDRALGTADNQIQVIGNRSGFEGQGTSGLTVRLDGTGNQAVQWGSANFDPSVLVLQSPNANLNANVNFDTAVDLNGADRTIDVDVDHGNGIGNSSFNDGRATMNQAITNSSGTAAGLIKEGPGMLVFNGTNTYDGGTFINEGGVRYEKASAMPSTGTHAFAANTELQVRIGGGDDFTIGAGTAPGSLGGLLAGNGPGTSNVTYAGDLLLTLRGSGNVQSDIINVGGGVTSLWLLDGNKTLSGNNTFTGELGVGRRGGNARTVTLGSNTALQGADVVVDTRNSSVLDLAGFDATVGNVQLGSNNGGNQGRIDDTVGGGTLTITGDVTLDGHNNGAGGIHADTVDLDGGTRTFSIIGSNNAASSLFVSSAIQNGAVTIDSTSNNGFVQFSGVSTYTGDTTVTDGTLNLTDTSELRFALQNSDTSNRVLGGGTVSLDGTFRLDDSAVTDLTGTWNLVDVAGLSETFENDFGLALLGGPDFIDDLDGTFSLVNGLDTWDFDTATGNLSLVSVAPIPEPSSTALLGIGGLALALRRRRQH